MEKTIVIDGDAVLLVAEVSEKLSAAATHLVEQNASLIMRDLAKTAVDSDEGRGELPVSVTFKIGSEGRRILIDAGIEWKRTKKCGDSLEPIVIDPDQKELSLDNADPDLVEQSIAIIKETGRASVSSIQRRLHIGYTAAAKIMDTLEERGIVGPARGSDPREILV